MHNDLVWFSVIHYQRLALGPRLSKHSPLICLSNIKINHCMYMKQMKYVFNGVHLQSAPAKPAKPAIHSPYILPVLQIWSITVTMFHNRFYHTTISTIDTHVMPPHIAFLFFITYPYIVCALLGETLSVKCHQSTTNEQQISWKNNRRNCQSSYCNKGTRRGLSRGQNISLEYSECVWVIRVKESQEQVILLNICLRN